MKEGTNLSPRAPRQREGTTWYWSLGVERLPSSKADEESHPQWLFRYFAEHPTLGRGTGSPEGEGRREAEGEAGEEMEVLPGAGGTPPTPRRFPWGGGEEPLPTRSCLLPFGGVPLPPKVDPAGAEGSFCVPEPGAEGLCPVPLSGYEEVEGEFLPLLRGREPSPLLSLEGPPLLSVRTPLPVSTGQAGGRLLHRHRPLVSPPPKC